MQLGLSLPLFVIALSCVLTGCGGPPAADEHTKLTASIESAIDASEPAKPALPMNGTRFLDSKHVGLQLPKEHPIYSFPESTVPDMVALTIDVEVSGEIGILLDALKEHDAKMTFFICGDWASRNKETLKRIADEGHEFGNHTQSHAWLTKASATKIREELALVEKLVNETTGKTTKPYFRPPYGAQSKMVNRIAAEEGYRNVLWSAIADDAVIPRPSADRVLPGLLALSPGSIYLLHSFSPGSIEAVVKGIPKLIEKGIRPVTLSDMIDKHLEATATASDAELRESEREAARQAIEAVLRISPATGG